MGTWIIRWNFDVSNYSPGQNASVFVWVDNTNDSWLYVSNLSIQFEFGTWNLDLVGGQIAPRTTALIGKVNISLPRDVVGRKLFSLTYRMQEYTGYTWLDLGSFNSDQQYFISIYPQPLYKIFLSRGVHTEDRVIGDPISEMIREWGLETVTVGVEVQAPEEQVAEVIGEHIKNSHGLIAIATPRFLDALTGLWRTLEWHHGEVGMAFGKEKPLLILQDNRVALTGLPSYLNLAGRCPVLSFDSFNLEDLRSRLGAVMPEFRGWLETSKQRDFWSTLGKVTMGGLAFVGAIKILEGISGKTEGQSKR